jgi:hypothetical protein
MMKTLDIARQEREWHVQEIAKLDKVIALLTDQRAEPVAPTKKRKRRQMSAESRTRQSASMKAVWDRRRKKNQLSDENRESEPARAHPTAASPS